MDISHLFRHSSLEGCLGCFHLSAIVNRVALSICTQIFILTPVFNSFRYMSGSRIAGSCGDFMYNLLRNCQNVFHSSCTILHSNNNVWEFSLSTSSPVLSVFHFKKLLLLLQSSSKLWSEIRWITLLVLWFSFLDDWQY